MLPKTETKKQGGESCPAVLIDERKENTYNQKAAERRQSREALCGSHAQPIRHPPMQNKELLLVILLSFSDFKTVQCNYTFSSI